MEIYKEVLQAAECIGIKRCIGLHVSDGCVSGTLKISQEHETTVQGIEERWQKLADNPSYPLNHQQKEAFNFGSQRAAKCAFEETESGLLDFTSRFLEDKLNADKAYEEARLEYYNASARIYRQILMKPTAPLIWSDCRKC